MSRWRIYRERVVERLRRSKENRVALLLAETGFGKSTALRQFLDGEKSPYSFYRVPPETTTLLAFLRGLTESLERFVPGAYLSLTIAHERAMQSRDPAAELATWFAEHLRDASLRITLDDLHNASADAVGEFLSSAIGGSPPEVQWLIATRPSKAFSPASWLAEREMDWPINEMELRFSRSELYELAFSADLSLSDDRVDTILELTGGWPSAAGLALVGADVPRDERRDESLQARYEMLAHALFERYDAPTQRFLLQSSVFGVLDRDVVSAEGQRMLTRLFNRDGIYIDELKGGVYRYDDLWRRFLLDRLARAGSDGEREAYSAAGLACESQDRWTEALAFYHRTGESDAIRRILVNEGLALIEAGAIDEVDVALDALGDKLLHTDPKLLALKGALDSQRARFDTSEAWFRLAIHGLEDQRLRLEIVFRYGLDLLRRSRLDCIEILEPAVDEAAAIEHELYPMLCSTLATAYAVADRFDDAKKLIARALPELRNPLSDALRARAYHQAAYVALRCGEIQDAERYAKQALRIALEVSFFDLAARANTILYEIAYFWDVDSQTALECVENVASLALKSGDASVREWALIAAYYIEAERGNGAMMSAIEKSLGVAEILQMTNETTTALLPGQALRATWSGDFSHAFRLLDESAEVQLTPDRRAFRWSEIALYAAAAGLREEAEAAITAALAVLDRAGRGKLAIQAIVYSLICLSLLGDNQRWPTLRNDERFSGCKAPLRALLHIADVLHDHWRGAADYNEILVALDEVQNTGFAGLALMFEALPAQSQPTNRRFVSQVTRGKLTSPT